MAAERDSRAQSSPSTSRPSSSLQRGRACGNCRKRKIKCDGLRPSCTQCLRSARPGDTCEYSDTGRTRTQMLEENISRLEARIRELEEPDDENSVKLHAPYAASSSSSAAQGSWSMTTLSNSSPALSSSSPSTSSPADSVHEPSPQQEPPLAVAQPLLDTFLLYAMDFGFFLNVSRFRESALLSLPLGHYARPCAGLLSTVYLLGLHLSGDSSNQEESAFLSRALLHAANMLSSSHPYRIVHGIQTEILLSVYFFRTGRILEGKYHLSAAVSLTLGAGLHKHRTLNTSSSHLDLLSVAGPLLPPPSDQIEEGERINAFWIAYTLSNFWGVAVGSLSSMVFENHGSSIDTPWPMDMVDYEQVAYRYPGVPYYFGTDGNIMVQELLPPDLMSSTTVQNFLSGVPSSSPHEFSTMALYAKSSILLDRAVNLATLYRPDLQHDEANRFGTAFASLDNLIDSFRSRLPPLDQTHTPSFIFGTVFATHTAAHVSTIHLHATFSSRNSHSQEKALAAAESCVALIRQVDMNSITQVNPLFGSLWTSVCQVLIREIARLRALRHAWAPNLSVGREEELVESLQKVLGTMAVFSIDSPLMAYQLAKIQEVYHSHQLN